MLAPRKQPAVHPGRILAGIIKDNGLSQTLLARHLKMKKSYINDICRGRIGISAAMAIKFGQAFGQSSDFWLNIQKSWELAQAEAETKSVIEPIKLRA